MSLKYLLPCECGRTTPVDVSQAGLSVSCECGQALAVPSIRSLRQLPAQAEEPVAPVSSWGARQGVALATALLVSVLLGMSVFHLMRAPVSPFISVNTDVVFARAQNLSLTNSFQEWEDVRQGIENFGALPDQVAYERAKIQHQRWTWIWLGSAALVALVGGGLWFTLGSGTNAGTTARRAGPVGAPSA